MRGFMSRKQRPKCRVCGNPVRLGATLTVAEAAAIKTHFRARYQLPGCTGNCENCTQCRCRAGAESQENTDTTTTTANHSKSNGCAPRATDENTNSGSAVVAEDDSVLARGMRFVYCPKASKKTETRL